MPMSATRSAGASFTRSTFAELRDHYSEALSGVDVVAIEHVGSTVVTALAAKPVLDIDIVVAAATVAAASSALEAIGFRSLGEQGILQRGAFRQPAELQRTNTYVVVNGSLALRNHIAVRDALRRDGDLRTKYADLKRNIASPTGDIATYVEAKSSLIATILRGEGLSEDETTTIENANRERQPSRQPSSVTSGGDPRKAPAWTSCRFVDIQQCCLASTNLPGVHTGQAVGRVGIEPTTKGL